MKSHPAAERTIESFWNHNPCGEQFAGGLPQSQWGDTEWQEFFNSYDNYRYRTEPHILRCLDSVGFDGKRVLEIGLGQGADSEQIIRRGGKWNGLDLTQEAVMRLARRLGLRRLPHEAIKQGSALAIPFADDHFDIVYSHGVLHHIPDIAKAQQEIARILKPGGRLVMMLYARHSLNYWLMIFLLRRIGLIFLYYLKPDIGGIYGEHIKNARAVGLWHYLRINEFINRNTDGPHNPYSRVYSANDIETVFSAFKLQKTHKEFMHAPPLKLLGWPGGSLLGWHLWAHMVVKK